MKLIEIQLNEYATLTGFLHEPSAEMGNIDTYPAILVLPGGGFRICSKREGEPVAMAFFAKGYHAFVLDYTHVTKKPDATIEEPMQDVQFALAHLQEHEKEYRIAPHKVAMIGFSGGGHLASASATHGPLRPDALVLGYPGIVHSDLRALECPDIIESVDEHTPPTFLFSTRDDQVTPPVHPLTFAQALDAAGVDFELHIFRSGVHGLSLANSLTCSGDKENVNPIFAQWFPMCVQWLTDKLGDFTIYGVNDGRFGRYGIDTPLDALLENEEAKAIVMKSLPMVAQAQTHPMMQKATLRQIQGYVPQISKETMAELDAKLQLLK